MKLRLKHLTKIQMKLRQNSDEIHSQVQTNVRIKSSGRPPAQKRCPEFWWKNELNWDENEMQTKSRRKFDGIPNQKSGWNSDRIRNSFGSTPTKLWRKKGENSNTTAPNCQSGPPSRTRALLGYVPTVCESARIIDAPRVALIDPMPSSQRGERRHVDSKENNGQRLQTFTRFWRWPGEAKSGRGCVSGRGGLQGRVGHGGGGVYSLYAEP